MCSMLSPTPSHSWRDKTEFADSVWYASLPATGGVGFVLTCMGIDGATLNDDVIATRAAYTELPLVLSGNGNNVDIFYDRVDSDGHMLEVASHELVWERRQGQRPLVRTGFAYSSSIIDVGVPHTAQWAWAIWGGPVTCNLVANGVDVPVNQATDGIGVWVPPSELSTGLYYTDGTTSIEAARTYDLDTPGGTAFIAITPGVDNFYTENMRGTVMARTVDVLPTVVRCGWPETAGSRFCERIAIDGAHHLSISETVYDPHRADAGELFIIALPPDAY